MAIYKTVKGEQVKLSSREIKATTMRLKGWTSEEYKKNYDLFKNKVRAYESFMEAHGNPQQKQSPAELLYKQAKAEAREGDDYQPSAKMKIINAFPAVSITKGRQLSKAVGSVYEKVRLTMFEHQTQVAFKNFIAQVAKAKEIDDAIKDPIKKEKALSALADSIHWKQKEMRNQEDDGNPFYAESYGSDPLGDDFDYSAWLD